MITSCDQVLSPHFLLTVPDCDGCYIMRSKMYNPNLLIGTADLRLMPCNSIEKTAEQHMPLVPD